MSDEIFLVKVLERAGPAQCSTDKGCGGAVGTPASEEHNQFLVL